MSPAIDLQFTFRGACPEERSDEWVACRRLRSASRHLSRLLYASPPGQQARILFIMRACKKHLPRFFKNILFVILDFEGF
jgi:hypothetical protein